MWSWRQGCGPRSLETDSPSEPQKEPACQHLDFGLLASRTGREYISAVLTVEFVVICYSCPGETDREGWEGTPNGGFAAHLPLCQRRNRGNPEPALGCKGKTELQVGKLRRRAGKGPRQVHTAHQGRHRTSTQLTTLPAGRSTPHGAVGPVPLLLSVFILNKLHL